MMKMIVVGIYPRVSSKEQVDGYSIDEQIDKLTKYCEAMGWKIYRIYTDPGYSGATMNRPGLQALRKDIHDGKLDKVVVYKLDRLSRSQKDTMYLIEDEFLAHGVDFVSMSENFDTSTPFGRAMMGILAVFAQLERENIKERTMIGKEGRAKDGKWHGSKWYPIGYDYDPDTDRLIVNPYEAMQIREAAELFLQGTPLRTIARIFSEKGYAHKYGEWDNKAIRRALRNRVYLGYIKHHENYYPGDHLPILDEETFQKVNEILDQRAEAFEATGIRPGMQTTYLGGLLRCKHCGGKYTKQQGGSSKYGKIWYYTCYSRCKKMKKMIKDPNCKNKTWRMTELDSIIMDQIRRLIFDPSFMEDIRRNNTRYTEEEKRIEIIRAEIGKLDDQISRYLDLYGLGKFSIDQVSAKVDQVNGTRAKLSQELDRLTADAGKITPEEAIELLESFTDLIDDCDFQETRSIIESLIDYIELDNEDIYIHWKFL